MFKYLLLALLLIWLFYSPTLRGKRRTTTPGEQGKTKPAPRAENMIECAHCGVHLPEGEALRDVQGQGYCSKAHLLAGPAQR